MRILWISLLLLSLLAIKCHAADEIEDDEDFDGLDDGMMDIDEGGDVDDDMEMGGGGDGDMPPPMTQEEEEQAKKDGVEDAISKYNGEWEIGLPNVVSLKNDYGLIVKTKARHHAISSKFSRTFDFSKGKTFIAQFEVKFQDGQECGGAYIKLIQQNELPDLTQFQDKTKFSIMFGPDKCGLTSKVHFIVQFKNPKNGTYNEHHAPSATKDLGDIFTDKKTHLYTLIIEPTGKYQVLVDQSEIMSGSLEKDLVPSIIPEKEVDDRNDKKPEEWDEREKIADPEAKKPEDWNEDAAEMIDDADAKIPADWDESESEMIPDPEAKKPEDWDTEMDGEWEAAQIDNPKCEELSGCGIWKRPQIKNPEYKGKWKAAKIANPAYKGKWSPKKIANPGYFEESDLFKLLTPISAVGLELWTMSDGILFDNFLIADEKSIGDAVVENTYTLKKMQEAKTIKSKTAGGGMFSGLLDAANDKPWLWALYVLVILVPIVLITVFCFSGGSKDKDAKKTDAPTGDDDVIEDPTQVEGAEGKEAEKEEGTPSTPRRSPRKVNKKQDLEESDEEEESEGEESAAKTELRKRPARKT